MKSLHLTSVLALLGFMPLMATPLKVGPMPGDNPWYLPGGEKGTLLKRGTELTRTVNVPAQSMKESSLPGAWRGILSIDGYGTVDGSSGEIIVEAVDSESGELIATDSIKITGQATKTSWTVIFSSEQNGSAAQNVFDRDPKADWHSRYGKDQAKPQHWIGIAFGETQEIKGVSYLPSQSGFANGVAKDYRVEIRRPGKGWETVANAKGTSDQSVADERKAIEVRFESAENVEGFRFVIESDWSGGGFGTAAEVKALGIDLSERYEAIAAESRVWLEISADLMTAVTGKSFGLRVRAGEGSVVVLGEPRFCRIHEASTANLFGRPNGGLGSDKLGAGLLGFDAMTEHQQTVLSLMAVRSQKGSVQNGTVLRAPSARFLPENRHACRFCAMSLRHYPPVLRLHHHPQWTRVSILHSRPSSPAHQLTSPSVAFSPI